MLLGRSALSEDALLARRTSSAAPSATPSSSHSIPNNHVITRKILNAPQPPEGMIRLSGPLEHDNIVNGDGLRAVIWTQGCPNHCPGCQNPETWGYESGFLVSVDEILERLAEFRGQTGLTFCGGEPFVQAKACREIAQRVREDFGWDVWSFSGFTYEQIKEAGGEAWEFLKSLDALIDGPFILSQKDLTLKFRGSRNQRLLRLKQGTGEILSIE